MIDITGSNRDHALDFLKIIATLVIVLHHYERAFGLHFETLNFGDGKFYFGYAVELFLIISGYLSFSKINRIQNGLDFSRYYSARYLRLMPRAAICTAVTAIYALYVWHGENFSLLRVIMVAFCFYTGRDSGVLFYNSHLWYLGVLLICYAIFYLIIFLSQRLKINWKYACFFMIVLGAAVYSLEWEYPFLNSHTARGYMAFFTGLMLASLIYDHRLSIKVAVLSLFIVIASTLILIFKYDLLEYGIIYFLTFIYFPALIIIFEYAPVNKALDYKIIGTMSKLCFGIYVWHFEFNTFCAIENERHGLGINFCSRKAEFIMLLIVIMIGIVSFYLIERPLSRFIRKKTGQRLT